MKRRVGFSIIILFLACLLAAALHTPSFSQGANGTNVFVPPLYSQSFFNIMFLGTRFQPPYFIPPSGGLVFGNLPSRGFYPLEPGWMSRTLFPTAVNVFTTRPYQNPFNGSLFMPFTSPGFPFPLLRPASTRPRVLVPGVVNLILAQAEEAITGANLVVGDIIYEYSETVQEGRIIWQAPGAAASVSPQSRIDLVVSLGPEIAVGLQLVADGFNSPVGLVSPPDETGRLFVVDRIGLIHVLMPGGEILAEPFLDLRDRMVTLMTNFDERGLLGLAFDPNFMTNNRFCVYYSAPLSDADPNHADWNHTSHISEFTVSIDNPDRADPNSERIILQVDEPQFNHDGGQLLFGPDDGYLYISLGDGGRADDTGLGHPPLGNGQDTTTLLGSILRIDVQTETPPLAYGIPPDNPFVGTDGRDEIFAYGFRNPFRMSFDAEGDHDLFVGDVGQNRWEEVDIVTLGGNYGWHIKEGLECFDPNHPNEPLETCPENGVNGDPLIDPIITYMNSNLPEGLGRSVIGGFVYRGSLLPEFYYGAYIFGDWSTSFSETDGTLFFATPPSPPEGEWIMDELYIASSDDGRIGEAVLGFGQDSEGEIYVLTSQSIGPTGDTGKVYRIVPRDASVPFINVFDSTLHHTHIHIPVVSYNASGWVVIHADSPGGAMLGHAHVNPGFSKHVFINFHDMPTDGQTLYAMLHRDEGVIGTFEFPGPDTPVQDMHGNNVVRSFVITVPAPVMVTVPDVVGMDQAGAGAVITAADLAVGSVTFMQSDTVPAGNVISQDPAAGSMAAEGTPVNLVISQGTSQETVSFSSQVQPIFTNSCIVCHNPNGSMPHLDLRAGSSYGNLVNELAGHSSGVLVVPGDSAHSVLYLRVTGTGLSRMPPGGSLTAQQISLIETWIDEGANNN